MKASTQSYQRMWEGHYTLTYCELKAGAYSHTPFVIGGEYRNYCYISTNGWVQAYAPVAELEHLKLVRYSMLMNQELARKTLEESRLICIKQDSLTDELAGLDPSTLTNKELADWYERYMQMQQQNQVYFTVSQPEMLASVQDELEQYVRQVSASENEFVEWLSLLTAPGHESILVAEEKAWVGIVLRAARNIDVLEASRLTSGNFETTLGEVAPDLVDLIESHAAKYEWLPTQEFNPPWNKSHYIRLLHEELQTPVLKVEQHYNAINNRSISLREKREILLGQLLPPPSIIYQALLLQEMAAIRWNLRLVRTKADFVAKEMRQQIAGRMGITPYQVEYLLLNEIYAFLRGGSSFDLKEMENRLHCYVWQINKGKSELVTGDRVGEIAQAYDSHSTYEQINRICGQTASLGFARGEVRVIPTAGDHMIKALSNIKQGEILITGQIRPQLIVACRKAKAIVTDEGGIASHAAVVARELGVPCIVGTRDATKILSDGDVVEINANSYVGVVSIISRKKVINPKQTVNHQYIKLLSEAGESEPGLVGNKAYTLGKLIHAGLKVPYGFVVTTEGTGGALEGLSPLILKYLQEGLSPMWAVRSSATCEDSLQFSFAGMFESFLSVSDEDVISFIKRCIESGHAQRVKSYCETTNLDPKTLKMAVIIQEMVPSTASGICFTTDPVNKDSDQMRISACFGLGALLVSGVIIPDEYLVSANDLKIKDKLVAQQNIKLECRGGRNLTAPIPEALQGAQKITDEQIVEVCRISLKIATTLGFPVEVEWAIRDDVVNVLQARPVTSL